jgi:RNA polymerase sigma factor (sigma-70 family)
MAEGATHKAIETVWRIESARLIGGLVRVVRDVALAEDLAQEALVVALERWPETGIPENPGAWLMVAAKNRAIDHLRHHQVLERKHRAIEHYESAGQPCPPDLEADEDVGDDLLRLVLVACHSVLSTDARVALTLRLIGGLTTAEIARAYLVPEPTIAQRVVRAKRTLAEARVPFEVPLGAELAARIPSVLEVIYLIFNEGYAATRGDEWMRAELCEDALRIGRILACLVPGEAEVHGLVALMELRYTPRARVRAWAHPASRSCSWIKTAPDGTGCSRSAGSRHSRAPNPSRGRSVLTRSRPRSRRAMCAHAPPLRPTGRRSLRSMMRSLR